MDVEAKWIEQAILRLAAIIRALFGAPDERRTYLEITVRLIEDHLKKHGGRPPESIVYQRVHPETRVWEYISGVIWIVYIIRPKARFWSRLFGRAATEIIIR